MAEHKAWFVLAAFKTFGPYHADTHRSETEARDHASQVAHDYNGLLIEIDTSTGRTWSAISYPRGEVAHG